MNEDIKNKVKEYISKYRNYALALNGWMKLKNKSFTTIDALEAIYVAANGKPMEMNNIITALTKKNNVYGRRGHVYSDVPTTSIDIVYDNGKLSVIGYKGAINEPQTNNISPRNPNIFRKSDGQTKIPYRNSEELIKKITKFVRTYLNSSSDEDVIKNVKSIMNYAQKQKISYDSAMEKIKKQILSKQQTYESKKIIVGENAIKVFEAIENEITYYSFLSNVKSFLKDLLNNPSTAKPSIELKAKGLNRSKLLFYLLNKGIITRDEKIVDKDENGNPQTAVMSVKFKVPKKDFDRKMQKLYINLFEKNLPEPEYSNFKDDNTAMKMEDSGGGATNATSSGQFSQPVFDIQRREIYNTKPNDDIEEATTTMNTGDYQYTVPFTGDKSTLSRKNGKDGSISINRIK